MHRYLCEFDYRWNTRNMTDAERMTSRLLKKSRSVGLTTAWFDRSDLERTARERALCACVCAGVVRRCRPRYVTSSFGSLTRL